MKTLYFIKGAVPTKEELTLASKIEGTVVFRNASVVGLEDKPEECDATAGKVPKIYSKKDKAVTSKPAAKPGAAAAAGAAKPSWQSK